MSIDLQRVKYAIAGVLIYLMGALLGFYVGALHGTDILDKMTPYYLKEQYNEQKMGPEVSPGRS